MADPIRDRLNEHRMHRGTCLGCTRRFGGFHYECAIRPEVDALRAALDLHAPRTLTGSDEGLTECSHCYRTTYPCGTVLAIADALGVTE